MSLRTTAGALLVCALLISGCARLIGRAPDRREDPEAQELVRYLEGLNSGQKSFKGVGRIKVRKHNEMLLNERVAWVGEAPGKFRIEVLFSGQSLIKVASDGEWLYFLNRTSASHPYGQLLLSPGNLEKILAVPVHPSDFISILSGRIPLRPHDLVRLQRAPGQSGVVLTLEKYWDGVTEKIYLNEPDRTIRRVDMIDPDGSLRYRIEYLSYHSFDRQLIADRLMISTDREDRLQLDISHYWANVPVNASLFFLAPP